MRWPDFYCTSIPVEQTTLYLLSDFDLKLMLKRQKSTGGKKNSKVEGSLAAIKQEWERVMRFVKFNMFNFYSKDVACLVFS